LPALAIDLGGSHATCGVVAGTNIIARRTVPASGARGLKVLLPALAAVLRELLRECGLEPRDCEGVALAFCGIVDTERGRVLSTNQKYDDACGLDLNQWCREALGLPLRVENDARMALLGEHCAGAGRGVDDLVIVTLGSGIGGASMMCGRLVRGRHFQAGCLGGHLPISLSGRTCTCGNLGCVETEASNWALPGICAAWPGFAESALAGEQEIDFGAVFRAAAAGDRVALEVRENCLRAWAAGTVALIHAYDPEVVLFGGGVMQSGEVILPFIENHVRQHAWTPWGKVQIRAAELGNDAALLGAEPLLRGIGS
jgi:glucokinase